MKSKFWESKEAIEKLITGFKHNQKSLNRKSRKEFVEMFKTIAEEKTRLEKIRDILGVG